MSSVQVQPKFCYIPVLKISSSRSKIAGLGFGGGGRTEAAARKTNFEGHEMDDGVGGGGGEGGGDCRWMDGRTGGVMCPDSKDFCTSPALLPAAQNAVVDSIEAVCTANKL